MKKLWIFILIISLVGCTTPVVPPPTETPVTVPETNEPQKPEPMIETPEPETVEPETAEPETVEPETKKSESPVVTEVDDGPLLVSDYFPTLKDTLRTYKGEGNEYASFSVRTEYIEDDLVQFHFNNGATETVNIYRIDEQEVRLVYTKAEQYHRYKRLGETTRLQERVLLRAPLEVGRYWIDPSLGEMTIISLDEPVTILDSITVPAIAVQGDGVINYYAKGYGLVKTDYPEHGITSILESFEIDKPYLEKLDLVTIQETGLPSGTMTTFEMKTNDSLAESLSEALKRPFPSGLDLPEGFLIRQIEVETPEDLVRIDLSSGIYDWPVSLQDEEKILRELGLTLKNYFNVSQIFLSVEGGDYDSGTLKLDQNQPLE